MGFALQLYVPRQQFSDLVDFVVCDDAQNVGEVFLGVGNFHERCPLFMPRVLNPLGYCSALLAGLTKPRQSDPSYGLIGFSTDPVLQA